MTPTQAITITVGGWVVPTIMTAVMLGIMLRPYQESGWWDIGAIFRLFWLIPILAVWVAYMALKLWLG